MTDMSTVKRAQQFCAPNGDLYESLGERATKSGCKRCGFGKEGTYQHLWWAKATAGGGMFLVAKDGSRHVCARFAPATPADPVLTDPDPDLRNEVRLTSPATPEIPLPAIVADSDDEALRALAAVLKRPSITPEAVREMVAAGIAGERASILTDAETLLDQIRNGQPRAIEVKYADRATVRIDHVHPKFEKILKLALEGANVFMVGPKGSGKSTIMRQVATALGIGHHVVTCNPMMTKSDLIGGRTVNGFEPSDTVEALTGGGVVGFDEYDALGPQVQTLLNDAISSRELFLPNGAKDDNGKRLSAKFHADTIILAAGNTVGRGATKEYGSRVRQDDAATDRFIFVKVDHDENLENTIVAATGADMALQVKATKVCRDLRRAAADASLPYSWGVRAMVDIIRAVKAGLDHDEIVYGRLSRGMPDNDWQVLQRAVKVPVLSA